MAASKVKVLIVDDSALVRAIIRRALAQHPQIEVVGLATDGLETLRQIKALKPDVVTLDVEMPRLNGIGVLERVVGKAPVSFVMCSTLTQAGGQVTMEALQKGAFDYIAKPKGNEITRLEGFQDQLVQKVLAAARAKGRTRRVAPGAVSAAPKLPPNHSRGWLVAIGISCGGPQTLMEMLPAFPSEFPPIVVTQHMPAPFTKPFAARLNNLCAMEVKEAEEGDKIAPGKVLVAPGGYHLKLVRHGVDVGVELDDGPEVSRHRPSVDVMFASAAQTCGSRAIGVIMTGMGSDGARGITDLHNAGAWTIAQDEATSLVYGMPKAAVATGCVDHSVRLDRIPFAIVRLMERGLRKTPTAVGSAL
ncbi:MAG TPA: chemotaxis response regulator protein-glutamate methylesterase [Phycisphaerae bacterium]|nr:chemotaxis response regulator protein-glutamate methylesterase [Phycisphaerae bacterium]HNU46489.1 chemotaxis response regulator protein-glutamate methylesterase [Phycisphaerae bacterium]